MMKIKSTPLLGMALTVTTAAIANTPLLNNTDFSNGSEGWIAGANLIVGGEWQAFVTAPETFSFDDRITAEGDGFVFTPYDDNESDKIESYVFQEFTAGPPTSGWPTIFETDDVIVFKGSTSAVRTGTDTSDMVVRAFIKTLGYNELGWEFQTKAEYSDFHDIGSALEPFELSITYPDITADDSLQVIQLGFEITTEFDGANMDTGEIYFENIEGYIETETGSIFGSWAGYEIVNDQGDVDTGTWMGFVNVSAAPYIYSYALGKYIYIDEASVLEGGAWVYVPQM